VFATGRKGGSEADKSLENHQFDNVLTKIANLSLPSISIISGTALGLGFEIALACDLRISDRSSKFGFYSDVSPTSISKASLIELTGPAKAKEMIWLGQLFSAQEAIDVGMLNRIFPESLLLMKD
jgi:enoyl-CoA hydratase/carnithine racemase